MCGQTPGKNQCHFPLATRPDPSPILMTMALDKSSCQCRHSTTATAQAPACSCLSRLPTGCLVMWTVRPVLPVQLCNIPWPSPFPVWSTHKYRDLQMSLAMQRSQKVIVLGWISVAAINPLTEQLGEEWFALSRSLCSITLGSQIGTWRQELEQESYFPLS